MEKVSCERKRPGGLKYINRSGKVVTEKKPLPANCTKCRFKCNENFRWETGDSLPRILGIDRPCQTKTAFEFTDRKCAGRRKKGTGRRVQTQDFKSFLFEEPKYFKNQSMFKLLQQNVSYISSY